MHLDAPYFWGASRVSVPQWLLVTMVFSGLFQDKFVDQVQVSQPLRSCAAAPLHRRVCVTRRPLPPAAGCRVSSRMD